MESVASQFFQPGGHDPNAKEEKSEPSEGL